MTIFTKANKIAIGKIFLLLYDHTTIPNNVSFPIFVSLSDFSILLNIKSSIVHHFVVNLLIVFILSRTNYHTIKQSNDNKNFFHHKHIHLILNLLSENILARCSLLWLKSIIILSKLTKFRLCKEPSSNCSEDRFDTVFACYSVQCYYIYSLC